MHGRLLGLKWNAMKTEQHVGFVPWDGPRSYGCVVDTSALSILLYCLLLASAPLSRIG